MYRLKAVKKLPAKEFQSHNRLSGSALTILAILLLASTSAHARGSPFDTGFNALQTLFTGTIAKVASLIAIVIGGYCFPHGEPGAKKALAGVAAGTGISRCLVLCFQLSLELFCLLPAPRLCTPADEWTVRSQEPVHPLRTAATLVIDVIRLAGRVVAGVNGEQEFGLFAESIVRFLYDCASVSCL